MTSCLPVNARAPDLFGADPPVDLDHSLAGASDDRGRRMLTVLKFMVAADDEAEVRASSVDAHLAIPDDLSLARAITGVARDRVGRSRRRRDGWLDTRSTAADVRPNIVVRGEAVSSVPTQLLRWWATGRHDCVVIDVEGRYAQIDLLAPGGRYVDVAQVSMDQLRVLRTHQRGVSVLDFSHVPAAVRSRALGRALSVVAAQRARTGHPQWMMIDDGEAVLGDPDIPPHVLDLSQRGHCLVLRSTDGLPDALATSIDVIASSGCSGGD